MEPDNRPYIAPDTEPGDTGTEEWADTVPAPGAPAHHGPLAEQVHKTDIEGALEGSPADEFLNDPNAIGAHNPLKDRG